MVVLDHTESLAGSFTKTRFCICFVGVLAQAPPFHIDENGSPSARQSPIGPMLLIREGRCAQSARIIVR